MRWFFLWIFKIRSLNVQKGRNCNSDHEQFLWKFLVFFYSFVMNEWIFIELLSINLFFLFFDKWFMKLISFLISIFFLKFSRLSSSSILQRFKRKIQKWSNESIIIIGTFSWYWIWFHIGQRIKYHCNHLPRCHCHIGFWHKRNFNAMAGQNFQQFGWWYSISYSYCISCNENQNSIWSCTTTHSELSFLYNHWNPTTTHWLMGHCTFKVLNIQYLLFS